MQATYVKFENKQRELLKEEALRRGCTISDLVRQATIHFFNLPVGGPKATAMEQTDAASLPSRDGLGAASSEAGGAM